jgi:heme/copper-type cytochrome/quinol oxidase subunit 1
MSIIAIGFLSTIVGHHMFVSGMNWVVFTLQHY